MLSLKVHSTYLYNVLAHRDLENITQRFEGKGLRNVADIPPCPTLLFPLACFLVNPFSEWVMGFTAVNMIITDTICNENNHETEK